MKKIKGLPPKRLKNLIDSKYLIVLEENKVEGIINLLQGVSKDLNHPRQIGSKKGFYAIENLINEIGNAKDFEDELIEKLADMEHQRWIEWMKYQEKILELPEKQRKKIVDRWHIKMKQSYKQLTVRKRNSDRVFAKLIIHIIKGGNAKLITN